MIQFSVIFAWENKGVQNRNIKYEAVYDVRAMQRWLQVEAASPVRVSDLRLFLQISVESA